ncbi:hypothetical protein AURDEDRAFT_80220 [Auricularia subglabra TFB-10046 SS5]|nr:hypothetical protein AURDEDRAFT_80220 [Auricularia subglabra TFB-10046 SS5]
MPRAAISTRSLARRFSTQTNEGWQAVIGLEIHAQIKSRNKLFSGILCTSRPATSMGSGHEPPNTRVSCFDAAFPGTMPKIDVSCVEAAVRTALAVGARVQSRSTFDRKHYFYPDLPLGYQITQNYAPLAVGGALTLPKTGSTVRLKQLQLEQDTGKSHAQPGSSHHAVDLNRAGAALMEIVSEPDMRHVVLELCGHLAHPLQRTAEEAADYVRGLQVLLRSLGVGNARMEDGSLRCDVNVSVHREGQQFGTRCEVKNLNSLKSLVVAINSEIQRHVELLSSGETIEQETLGFDESRSQTYSLRKKEDAPDYRYLPDANLPPLHIDRGFIEHMRQTMPELPDAIQARLQRQYGLNEHAARGLLALDAEDGEVHAFVRYFETAATHSEPTVVANWIVHELHPQLCNSHAPIPVSAEQIGRLADMVRQGDITYASGREVLRVLVQNPTTDAIEAVVGRMGMRRVSQSGELEELCKRCIEDLPEEAMGVRDGNERVLNRMIGYVRRLSKGTADPAATKETLLRLLVLDN